jgi:hypothetical protein
MKLVHNEENELDIKCHEKNDIDIQYHLLLEELRTSEKKFYQVFDINPCPMSIHDLKNNKLIDVNISFLNIVGVKTKCELLKMDTSESGMNLLSSKDKTYFFEQIKKNGKFENYYFCFNTMKKKKLHGLVSGIIIELNKKNYLLSVCQIVPKNIIKCFFLKYIL